ncbi:MAG: FAD-dependent oxidoreductase, partial [Firmicutes bacterium]|nr:FAD-dependent oxidoreductase [Bacillota bacterium]
WYAVEYGFVFLDQLYHSLLCKTLSMLFRAVQINGTSGYEEAAAQGLVAGVNAARAALGKGHLCLGRSQAYAGVMIDDLVTKGVDEPYRMLTSRAEHRILLRHDNADLRLTPVGREIGLVNDADWEAFCERRARLERGLAQASSTSLGVREAGGESFAGGATIAEALRRPEIVFDDIANRFPDPLPAEIGERVAIEIKCEGYVSRQRLAIEKAARTEGVAIPERFDYDSIRALSLEAREKLAKRRPRTLGAAGRIPGVTPSDVAILSVFVHRDRSAASC